MFRKILLLLFTIVLIFAGWLMLLPCTDFKEERKILLIKTGENNKEKLIELLINEKIIKNTLAFEYFGDLIQLWPRVEPGKYEIKKQYSLFQFIQMLRNHKQLAVNLVITKLRTPQQLAGLVGKKFECDSGKFSTYIKKKDSLKKFNVDEAQLLFIVHPNTYTYYWNAAPEDILKKMHDYHTSFWNERRQAKAQELGLTSLQATTLASIVEEETLVDEEKPVIARVYLNRLAKGMPLGADPTVKFATGDFSLRRIMLKHIKATAQSPYNTYINKGLPPGPICTPQDATIDAVLNPDDNDYLFFCAAPGYNGTHKFAVNDKEHLENARIYQQWLNNEGIR